LRKENASNHFLLTQQMNKQWLQTAVLLAMPSGQLHELQQAIKFPSGLK